jgi:hypothetical protein
MDRVLTNGPDKVNRVKVPGLLAEIGMKTLVGIVSAFACAVLCTTAAIAEDEPQHLEVVDFSKLIPVLPDAPKDWTADKAEGTTDDAGGVKITSVHRDYKKGDADNTPTTSISILDSAANPDYVSSTTAAWNMSTSTAEGYTKALKIDDMPGFETFENEGKHGTLWLMVAKRYILQIETQAQDSKELQEWLKHVDLKKLAAIK